MPDVEDDDPMDVDEDEFPGFRWVKVYLDGRREGYDGGITPAELTDIEPCQILGRYIFQVPSAPQS